MSHNNPTELEIFQHHIKSDGVPDEALETEEWGGADVVIKERLDADTEKWLGEEPFVIGFQSTQPRRRAVITKHSKELSWLFLQLRDIFSERIDYITKYDFFGLLAQSAIDYLAVDEESQNASGLLLAVLDTAKGFSDDEASV